MVYPCAAKGLGPWDQVGCYCERALDAAFWAEPLNALSNVAFLIAALMAYADLRTKPAERGHKTILALIILTMAIGAGSFLFHTLATVWARAADVIPIAVFVFAYLYVALRWYVRQGRVIAFGVAAAVALAGQAMPPWFNGSFGYAPVLLALWIVGLALWARRHTAMGWVLAAAATFSVSLVFRTLDGGAGCFVHPAGATQPLFVIGTHPVWHILNAAALYLLLRAAVENPPPSKP